jgi:hypothetical protein
MNYIKRIILNCQSNTIKRILDNEVATRDIEELELDLSVKGYIDKYNSWDNHERNIGRYSLRTYSGVSTFRRIINSLLNENKKLKEEIELLKSNNDISSSTT